MGNALNESFRSSAHLLKVMTETPSSLDASPILIVISGMSLICSFLLSTTIDYIIIPEEVRRESVWMNRSLKWLSGERISQPTGNTSGGEIRNWVQYSENVARNTESAVKGASGKDWEWLAWSEHLPPRKDETVKADLIHRSQNGLDSLPKNTGCSSPGVDTTKSSGVWDEPSLNRKHHSDEHGNPWIRSPRLNEFDCY
jgi:hypothetical protein